MKKILAIVLTFVLCFGVLSLAFATDGNESSATVPDGYTGIYTAEDLNNIRNNLSGKYILMNDIDLTSYGNWNPIGTSETPFTGELDGNGYSLKNMTIIEEYIDADTVDFGLFGWIDQSTISNLIIQNSEINIKYIGNEDTKCRFGVIAAFSNISNLNNCVVSGNVVVEGFSKAEVGGIAGRNKTTICYLCGNYSNIKVIIDSSATQISAGGISGYATAGERECFNYGDITATGTDINDNCVVKIGGIDGKGCENIGLIDSYNRGRISVDFSNKNTYVGGLSGDSYVIKNCYNSGNISVPDEFIGYAGTISGNINNDLIGYAEGRIIKDSYYIDDEFIPAYVGTRIPENFTDHPFENVKLLNDKEMETQTSFVGFDFDSVWVMKENGYPVLQNEPVVPEDNEPASSSAEQTTKPTTLSADTTLISETSTDGFTETTTVTESSTVSSTIITPTEATTEPSTEPSTEPVSDPNGIGEETCWLIKLILKIIDFLKWIFTTLGY